MKKIILSIMAISSPAFSQLNPNIILQGQGPQIQSPMDMAIKAQQLKMQQQQIEMQNQQMEMQREQMELQRQQLELDQEKKKSKKSK